MDAVFIAYDFGSIIWDAYHLVRAPEHEKAGWRSQLVIDTGALLLDGVFFFLPITGGGTGLRLALEGGHVVANGALRTEQVARACYKGVQFGGQLLQFAKFKRPKSGARGRQGATDIPSWARGEKPFEGESGKDFAKRLLDARYGPRNYPTGPGSEFNKLKKFADRHFE